MVSVNRNREILTDPANVEIGNRLFTEALRVLNVDLHVLASRKLSGVRQ